MCSALPTGCGNTSGSEISTSSSMESHPLQAKQRLICLTHGKWYMHLTRSLGLSLIPLHVARAHVLQSVRMRSRWETPSVAMAAKSTQTTVHSKRRSGTTTVCSANAHRGGAVSTVAVSIAAAGVNTSQLSNLRSRSTRTRCSTCVQCGLPLGWTANNSCGSNPSS